MEEQQKQHIFEGAGLGKAPFRFIGTEQKVWRTPDGHSVAAGACDYCGTNIRFCFWLQSTDGKQFYVGSECIRKHGDAGLRKVVAEAERKRRAELSAEKYKEDSEVVRLAMQKHEVEMKGSSHPSLEGRTLYDYAEWMLAHAGHSGMTDLARRLRRQFPDLGPVKERKRRAAAPGKKKEAPRPAGPPRITRALVPIGPVVDNPPRQSVRPAMQTARQKEEAKEDIRDKQLWLLDYTFVETLKMKDMDRIHSGFKQSFIPSVIEQFQTKGYLSPFQREIIMDMFNDKDRRNEYRLRVIVGFDTKEEAIRTGYVTEKDFAYPFDIEKHRQALEVARQVAEHLKVKPNETLPMAKWNPSGKQRPSWDKPWMRPRLSR